MTDLSGQYLGQYQILSRIAKGSVATIYKAFQPKLERYVAIKVLSPHNVDEEEFLERFSQEARAIAQLDHPNIVPVYDFDRLGDTVYLVMKYVEGGTLKEMMWGRPLDLGLTVELISQVGLALGYAHKRGVIHRDVKPSNVLIAEGHWALLTDFGLAKIVMGDRKLTRSGVGMGTPDYMAPEQAEGLPLDHRADLYSLGSTLYEMVTGRVPFEAESEMAVLVKHFTEPPVPPRKHNSALPPEVESVILTAMEKQPERRYQTAEEFIRALVEAARSSRMPGILGASVPARGLSGVESGVRPAPRPFLSETSLEEAAPMRRAASSTPPREAAPVRRAGSSTPPRKISRTALPAVKSGRPSFKAIWSNKLYRVTIIAASVLAAVFLCTLALFVRAIWQMGAALPATPIPTVISIPSPLPPTATATVPPPTPTDTPEPTATFTPTPTEIPTEIPNLRYLSPGDPIIPGIYVKVTKAEGINLYQEAGADQILRGTIPVDFILYVMNGPKLAGDAYWILARDLTTGVTGWGRVEDVAAYAMP